MSPIIWPDRGSSILLVKASYFRSLIMPLTSIIYLYICYPPIYFSTDLFIGLSTKNYVYQPIKWFSSILFFEMLSLLHHLIEFSIALGVSWDYSSIDEKLSGMVSVTQLISTSVLGVMIFLRRWDMAEAILSYI